MLATSGSKDIKQSVLRKVYVFQDRDGINSVIMRGGGGICD